MLLSKLIWQTLFCKTNNLFNLNNLFEYLDKNYVTHLYTALQVSKQVLGEHDDCDDRVFFLFHFTSYLYQSIGVKRPHMTLGICWFWLCLLNSWAWVHIYGTSHVVISMASTCNIMSCEGTYSFRWNPNHQSIDIYFT